MFGIKKQSLQPNDFAQRYKNGEKLQQLQKEVDLLALENTIKKDTADTQDYQNLVDLRNAWGKVILGVLLVTIVFNITLVIMVGVGLWKFENNSTFLNVAATENLVQVVGLVAIVLKSLFSENKHKK